MYSVIDIESNGAGFRQESIIDIAIYKYDGHRVVDQFISLVNPEAEITNYVQKLTNISPKMVKTAPKFHEIAKRVVEITEGTTLVGHNIDFDYRMLRQSFQRLGYDFKINVLDTIPLAQKLIPDAASYSLGKLVRSLGIPLTDQHRAAGDARATLELFKLLITKDTESEIIRKQFDETNAKTYINKIKELTQDLPNEKGIIYFQNGGGEILHSAFADNVNRFAKKVFNSKSERLKKLQQNTEQIHYELVGNDFLASLILKSKNLTQKSALPFALYFKSENFLIEKFNKNSAGALVKFSSYSQAMKALRMIKASPELSDYEHLNSKLNLKNKSALYLLPGRVLGEKSFLILEDGKITSFGFYELYTQISKMSLINQLKIDLQSTGETLLNGLKLMLLSGEATETKLPA